jgi:RHH-type proline utilization regulon transcriptional repressor/proline dehydrogenase/delta 1-pyrroline-5-carboxylate dehydrogenase
VPVVSPFDVAVTVGTVRDALPSDVDRAVRAAHAAQHRWDLQGGPARAALLERAADLFEERRELFYSLCIREAGKTLPDAVLEVREAVDFLRFYAGEARTKFGPTALPGPTGELNELRLHGRGVWACISRGISRSPSSSARSPQRSLLATPPSPNRPNRRR